MAEVSRRLILGVGVTTVAAAAASTLDPIAAGAATSTLTRRTYAAHIGKTFTAVAGRTTRRMRLVRIGKPLVKSPSDLCFTLVFEPVGAELPERIYSVRRAGVATHSLLLSSLGTDGLVQAVINRAH